MNQIHPKLRHKLFFVVAVIITTLLCTGILAIVRMERILNSLEQIETNTLTHLETTDQLIRYVTELSEAHQSPMVDRADHEVVVKTISGALSLTLNELLESPMIKRGDSESELRMVALCQLMQEIIGDHKGAGEETLSDHSGAVQAHARQIQDAANDVVRSALEYSTRERMEATRQFRWALASIAIVLMIILDVLLVLLIRISTSVLKPVDTLIEAGARIKQNLPGGRISLHRQDEFDDLEQIFNDLVDQIDTSEHRMVDTVHQVARSLSHELNNAIAIVDLQLACIERTPGVNEIKVAQHMDEIHRAMIRVSAVVGTLSRVQRIVLTDYLSGVQMLDLQKSTTEGESSDEPVQS